MRFYHITTQDFLFYDEGMYLAYNRSFLNLVEHNPPKNISEFLIILKLIFNTALTTPKALWFFLVNMRVFIVGVDGLYFSRILSAICGLLTIGLTFFFARRYFKSTPIAIVSAVVLALLPSHVFYSRQGMQEALSTLLFLGGMYCFVFSKKSFNLMVAASALCMFAVFLTNYRMIVAPIFVILIWGLDAYIERSKLDFKKLLGFLAMYAAGFILLGLLENGINLKVNAAWMLNQAGESGVYRQWYNFLSFPYYLFKLENVIFGLMFFCSFYLCLKRQFSVLLPFLIVLLQMFIFSFAAEKGARYLCVVLPFACMATAYVIGEIYKMHAKVATGIFLAMIIGFIFTNSAVIFSTTSYAKAIADVKTIDHKAKMITTQPVLEQLFVDEVRDVVALPKSLEETAAYVRQGYRYLIIDPQLYISWTTDERRFSLEELAFIKQLRSQSTLIKQMPHLNRDLLERFVLDHNQDLFRSLHFLSAAQSQGDIFIYDLGV